MIGEITDYWSNNFYLSLSVSHLFSLPVFVKTRKIRPIRVQTPLL